MDAVTPAVSQLEEDGADVTDDGEAAESVKTPGAVT
jgi:hypothetical protein